MLLEEPKGKVARVNTLYFIGCDLLCEKTHNISLKVPKILTLWHYKLCFLHLLNIGPKRIYQWMLEEKVPRIECFEGSKSYMNIDDEVNDFLTPINVSQS
jgi:hypothetical protein